MTAVEQASPHPASRLPWGRLAATLAGLAAAAFLYTQLEPIASWLTYQLLGLTRGSHLAAAVEFFIFETPKVLMLLVAVIFVVGVLRTFVTPERTRRILAGGRESVGHLLAVVLGVATPFCTCSSIPLFIGFVAAGVPLGVTFTFLVASPLVSEVAFVLLFALFGWKIALLYLVTGIVIAIVTGWVIGRLHMEDGIEPWALAIAAKGIGSEEAVPRKLRWADRGREAASEVREIVGRVGIYVVLGIAVGAGIHGYVPTNFLASFMGRDAWWGVPLAVLLGVPMYANGAGIIPVVQALLGKGAALGTVLAFMMSVIALSLPEIIILRKVLRPTLIAAFVGIVATGIMVVGHLFNLVI